jgi:hypothetical protein
MLILMNFLLNHGVQNFVQDVILTSKIFIRHVSNPGTDRESRVHIFIGMRTSEKEIFLTEIPDTGYNRVREVRVRCMPNFYS